MIRPVVQVAPIPRVDQMILCFEEGRAGIAARKRANSRGVYLQSLPQYFVLLKHLNRVFDRGI